MAETPAELGLSSPLSIIGQRSASEAPPTSTSHSPPNPRAITSKSPAPCSSSGSTDRRRSVFTVLGAVFRYRLGNGGEPLHFVFNGVAGHHQAAFGDSDG